MTEFLKQVVKNRLEQLDIDPANYVAKDFTEKRERIGKRNVVNLFQQQFLMKEMQQEAATAYETNVIPTTKC